MLNGIFIHACLQTFLQAARPALVSVGLVHRTGALTAGLTYVLSVSPDGSLKKPGTAVACIDPIVFPRRVVLANFTRNIC